MSPELDMIETPAQRWKVLYFRRPPWLVEEVESDRDARVRLSAFAPLAPDVAHYPGDPAGKVISVISADRDFSPGELADPNRAVVELELSEEDLHAIRGRESRILAGRPVAVTFDQKHGAIAPELKRRFPLDFLVREKEEEEARLAVDERNRQVELDWQAEVDTWRESLAEAIALEAVFETPLPTRPVPEPIPEPEFALAASRLTKLLPPTVVHSGAGLYKVDGSGAVHNDIVALAVKDNGTTTITLTTGIARDCTGEVIVINGNSYAIKSKTDDTHIVVVGDASAEGIGTGNDAYTKVLLHCDGTDGSKTFLDDSFSAPTHVVTANGAAEVDTAKKVFGTGSLLAGPTTADYVSTPAHADWQFGGGAFTIDFRVLFDTIGNRGICYCFFNAANFWEIRYDGTRLRFNNSTTDVLSNPWTPLVDTWYHIAVVHDGAGNWYILIEGVDEWWIGAPAVVPTPASALWVGRGNVAFDGQIDEFRVSKGIARWTSGFTPPTAAYSSSTGVCTISPYTTIQSAHDQLWTDQGAAAFTASQYIRIFADTYDENVAANASLAPSTTYGFLLLIEGDPAANRAAVVVAPSGGTYTYHATTGGQVVRHLSLAGTPSTAIVYSNAKYPNLEDLDVAGANVNLVSLLGSAADHLLSDSRVTLSAGNYTAVSAPRLRLSRCVISGPGTGIGLEAALFLEDCVLSGFAIGARLYAPLQARQIVNCTFYNCDTAVRTHYTKNPIWSVNNIMKACTTCYDYVQAWPEETATTYQAGFVGRNNCYHGYTNFSKGPGAAVKTYAQFAALNQVDLAGDLDDTDPLLTNPGSDDFSLQTTSPCWDTGHGSGVTTDYLGTVLDPAFPPIGAWSPGALVKTPPTFTVASVGDTLTVTLTGSSHRYRVRLETDAGVQEAETSRAGAGDVVFASVAVGFHKITAWAVTADDASVLSEPSVAERVWSPDSLVVAAPGVSATVSGTTVTVTLTGSSYRYRVRIETDEGVEETEVSRLGAGDIVFGSVAYGEHIITAWAVDESDNALGEHATTTANVQQVLDTTQTFEAVANKVRGRFKTEVADAAPWGTLTAKTTVSAASADNSFNDAIEDLSVFVARQQVLVSGFVNGSNNGYFTVVSATANKLVVSGATLTDEAATPAVTILSALPTQYDNDGSFERPEGAPWCRFTVLQGKTAQVSVGTSKRFRQPGVAIAQLFVPTGEGDKRGLELADAVKLAFRSVTAAGVIYMSPSVQNMGRQEGEWQLNVSCPFFADDLV